MMEYNGLHHKTRGSASPQGRPRVYFCCHEANFARMFEPITEEILAIADNAAIWYYDPAQGIPEDERFFADLSQMQLFVIPVTAKFIYQDNPARTVEFQYAIDHHIPVLPLMQESGLEQDFNRVCGDLQFLDKYAAQTDPTTLPYEDKLKKFLSSVLVSDELARRVRAAFDAYIFLSYRKKDRAYAQQIMRLIHASEFCRDIAIWYDEFLTPGENFNDAIAAAMEKSALFALVVTPSLLENPNYVMTTEYPEAKKSGKPILPIEALATDSEELSRLYMGIDPTLPPEEMAAKLREALLGIALRENDNDPAHNFLIGLAYLSGIGVEVDHERALALITSAAEADLPEAYEKLVSMYQTGEGVERDKEKAVSYQEELVGALTRRNEESPSEQNAIAHMEANVDLFHMYEDLSDRSFLVHGEAYLDAYLSCRALMSTYRSHRLSLAAAEFALVLAKLFQRGEDDENTLRYLQDARKLVCVALPSGAISALLDAPVDENGTIHREVFSRMSNERRIACDRCLLSICMEQAKIYRTQSKLEEASKEGAAAIEKAEMLVQETASAADISLLALCYVRHSYTLRRQAQYTEAEDLLHRAMELHQRLEAEHPGIQDHIEMAYDHYDLARLHEAQGDMRSAQEHYLQSLQLLTSATQGAPNLKASRLRGQTCIALGQIYLNANSLDEAERYYRQGKETLIGLKGQMDVDIDRLFEANCSLGDIALKKGDYEEFEANYFSTCQAMQIFIDQQTDDADRRRARKQLTEWYLKLGQTLVDVNARNEIKARMYLSKAFHEAYLLNRDEEDPRLLYIMYLSSKALAKGYAKEAAHQEAEERYKNAIQSLGRLVDLYGDAEDRADLAGLHFSLAQVYRDSQCLEQCIASMEAAREIYRVAVPALRDGRTTLRYALCLSDLGEAYARTAREIEAIARLEDAASVLEELHRADPENEIVVSQLGQTWFHLGELTCRRADLERALEIFTALAAQYPDAVRYRSDRAHVVQKMEELFGTPSSSAASSRGTTPAEKPREKKKSFFGRWRKNKS